MNSRAVRVGVGVLVVNSDKHVLIGKRKGKHGGGEYALPGGHLDFGESFEQCALREVAEETGLAQFLEPPRFAHAVNTVFDEQRHYVTVFMQLEQSEKEEPQNLEPDKCEGWLWVSWDKLPLQQPLFKPLQLLIDSGYIP